MEQQVVCLSLETLPALLTTAACTHTKVLLAKILPPTMTTATTKPFTKPKNHLNNLLANNNNIFLLTTSSLKSSPTAAPDPSNASPAKSPLTKSLPLSKTTHWQAGKTERSSPVDLASHSQWQ